MDSQKCHKLSSVHPLHFGPYNLSIKDKYLRGFHTFTDRTTDHRSGIIRVVSGITVYTPGRHPAWSLAHRHIWGKINFLSRSTRMKNDPYHSWKAQCSFRVATEYIREFRTRRMPVLIRGSCWLLGRNTVPCRSGTDHFSSVYSGMENCAGLIFYHG